MATKKKSDAQKKQKQALALWELVINGDGKTKSQRKVSLEPEELAGLVKAGLVAIVPGKRKDDPNYGSKLVLTPKGWDWPSRDGFKLKAAPQSAQSVHVLVALLAKVGAYLDFHSLAVDHLLRPRRLTPEPPELTPPRTASMSESSQAREAPNQPPTLLEQRIRAAYLRVTGDVYNEQIELVRLRAELPGEARDAVDAALLRMQQHDGVVLYQIDDPHRLRPEDEAAALRVAGTRKDRVCIVR